MQEQGSSFLEPLPSILLVSGPQDEAAIELLQRLRQAGLRVFFGDTVTLATRMVSETAGCVAVLRPDTRDSQTIAVATRAKPACLIPVLAEPMELPRGPWTVPAIDLSADAAQGTQELIQALRDYLATYTPGRTRRKQGELVSLDSVRIRRLRSRRRHTLRMTLIIIALLLILGLGGLLGYRYYTHPVTLSRTTTLQLPAVNSGEYHTNRPGPCDLNGGQWDKGGQYVKTRGDKKVVVLDQYTTLECRADGSLVTRTGDEDIYSELFFNGPAGQRWLATHYRAQVNATILAGDQHAGLTMDVHIQQFARYSFHVDASGYWEATINSQTDGSPVKTLAKGYLASVPKSYMLAIEVYGPTMTFWINDRQITSISDNTYTANTALAFGVDDYGASEPVSALFSAFQYKELPNTLTSAQLLATATAQAQQRAQTPYTARIPGAGCDKGAGQWKPLINSPKEPGTIHCLADGMQLTAPANAQYIPEEQFFWLNGQFPQNYKVSVQIDVSTAGRGCAGLGTRTQSGKSYGSYHFIICPNGKWAIVMITGSFQTLAQGKVEARNTYTITAESNGAEQSLSIDGQLIRTVKDSRLASTEYLSLDAGLYRTAQAISATFSTFIFTPLP